MIDDSRIQHAANQYVGHGPEVDEGIYVLVKRDAFRDGVEWFKKTIWHDASEEPEYSRYILAQRRTFIGELRYYLVKNNSTYPWELNVKDLRITKWCYIDDILPKGGEK